MFRKFLVKISSKAHANICQASYIPPKPGPIIDLTTGAKIHEHSGLWNYTIGQGARIPGLKEKTFVVRKDVEKNTIYIVSGRDNPLLRTRRIHVDKFSFIWTDTPPKEVYDASGYRAFVKVLHKMQPAQCTVFGSRGTDSVTIDFDEPLVGIAPGQVAVLYDTEGEWCLGCGAITDSIPLETQDVDCGP
ncbi:hypothetical protein H0H93_002318 [Arthromyces matolae]|nr:hypothetical protein H0H93_002318 [Arthromyces matolae]